MAVTRMAAAAARGALLVLFLAPEVWAEAAHNRGEDMEAELLKAERAMDETAAGRLAGGAGGVLATVQLAGRRAGRGAAEARQRPQGSSRVLFFSDARVDCKGQVWRGTEKLVDTPEAPYYGCVYRRGTCNTTLDNGTWIDGALGPSEDRPGGPLDRIVVLTQPQWGALFHFVIDGLSRLAYVQEQYPQLVESRGTFFHTGLSGELGQQWARLVGIPTAAGPPGGGGNRLLEGTWLGRSVVYPPSNQCSGGVFADAASQTADAYAVGGLRALIERTAPWAQPEAAPTGAYALLIERDARGHRGVRNHFDVLRAISTAVAPRGWKVRVHSYRSLGDVAEQCSLFHNAGLIVGPHGAGFVNLLCARRGTPVIELQQRPHALDFEFLAGKLGLPYIGVPTRIPHNDNGDVNVSSVLDAVGAAAAVHREVSLALLGAARGALSTP